MKTFLKKAKVPILITFLAVLAVSYYIYLNHRSIDNTDKLTTEENTNISRDMDKNYPSSYCDVMDYFVSLQEDLYKGDLSDDEIAGYAQHMRAMLDDELLSQVGNDYESYLASLELEIENYKTADKYIKKYEIQSRGTVEMYNLGDDVYSEVSVKYYLHTDDGVIVFFEKYTLRKDSEDRWKILYWEVSDGAEMTE